jgi:hypothetical protein
LPKDASRDVPVIAVDDHLTVDLDGGSGLASKKTVNVLLHSRQ